MRGLDLTIECRVSVVGVAPGRQRGDASAIRAGARKRGVLRGAGDGARVARPPRDLVRLRPDSQPKATAVDLTEYVRLKLVLRLQPSAARGEHGGENLVLCPR